MLYETASVGRSKISVLKGFAPSTNDLPLIGDHS